MRLFTYTNSERGKSVEKSGNDYLRVTLSVDYHIIGEVELYLNHDRERQGADEDEWILTFKRPHVTDPDIIAQGHTIPIIKPKAKVKTKAQ
jgi:hypothetical protein